MASSNTLRDNIAKFMFRDKIKSVTDLARISRVPQPTLSKFMSGHHQSLAFDKVDKLARAFNTDPARLFETDLSHLANPTIQALLMVMENMDADAQGMVVASSIAIAEHIKKKA